MTANLFESPKSATTLYYSFNTKNTTFSSLWRLCKTRRFLGVVFLFPVLVLYKLLRINTRAVFGLARPTYLSLISDDALSEDVHQALAPYDGACGASGMIHVFNHVSDSIGARSDVVSVWIDPAGNMSCSTHWVEVSIGKRYEVSILFSCRTWLDDGTEILTHSIKIEDTVPEGVRPEVNVERMPPESKPEDVISRHKQRIAGNNNFVYLTEETVQTEYLRTMQLQIDFLFEKQLFRSLSPMEIQRLHTVDPIAKKKMLVDG